MPVLRSVVASLTALMLAALGPVVAEAKPKRVATKVLTGAGQIEPGKDARLSDRCPKAFPHPVGTEFDVASDRIGLDAAAAFGRGNRGWTQKLRNYGDESEIFLAGPVCLRARGRFAYPTMGGVVPAGGTTTVTITCPSNAPRVLNGTLAPGAATVLARSARESARSWVVGVRNLSTVPQTFQAGAVCTSAKLRVLYRFTSPISVPAGRVERWGRGLPETRSLSGRGRLLPRGRHRRGAVHPRGGRGG